MQSSKSLAKDAVRLAAALVAEAHPRAHKVVRKKQALVVPRAKLKKMLVARWAKQKSAFLKGIRPHVDQMLMHQEADTTAQQKRQRALALAAGLEGSSLAWRAINTTAAQAALYSGVMSDGFTMGAEHLAEEIGGEIAEDSVTSYLRSKAFQLLADDIDQTTRDRLKTAVADAYGAGGGYSDIIDAIKGTFDGFSDTRADSIAMTELNDAFNQGTLQMGRENGAEEKAWDPDGEACEEICMPNVDDGWIDIDDDFSSGDDAPPGHTNCDCSISVKTKD